MDSNVDEPHSHGFRWAALLPPALRRWNLDRRETAMLLGVLVVTALVYVRCFGNGWVYDDHFRIVHNPKIADWSYVWESFAHQSWWFHKSVPPKAFTPREQNPKALPALPHAWTVKEKLPASPRTGGGQYYRPLQNAWEGLNYHLFGTSPLGWHVASVLLHLGVVLLVFRLAQLLTESTNVALLAALLFGVLGVHGEPVVWASAATEPLAAFFELASLCVFIPACRARKGRRQMPWALALFALATLSNETAVVFPVLIAAYVFLLGRPESGMNATPLMEERATVARRIGAALLWSGPFFGVAILYLAVRAIVLGGGDVFGTLHEIAMPRFAGGMLVFHSTVANHSFGQILATIPLVLAWYLKILVLPWYASPGYGLGFVTARHPGEFYVPVAIIAAVASAGFALFRKSPRRNLYLFCAVWFLLALAPAFSLNQIVSLVQDRYLYLPSFGFCVLVATWAFELARAGSTATRVAAVCATAIVLVNAVALWRAEPIWRSDLSMWRDCAKAAPTSLRCNSALATAMLARGDLKGALRQGLIAEKLAPDDPEIRLSLGMIYMRMGRGKDASREFASYYLKAFGVNKRAVEHRIVIKFK